jgi:hypothetical protein
MRTFLFALVATGLAATTAHAFTAINGLTVKPAGSSGSFVVLSRGGDGPRQIWCAAGQYARLAQGAGNHDRVYIVEGYGRSHSHPGYRAVTFTTRPSQALADGPRLGSDGDYSVSIRKIGFSLRAGQAENFCSDVFEDLSMFRRW